MYNTQIVNSEKNHRTDANVDRVEMLVRSHRLIAELNVNKETV